MEALAGQLREALPHPAVHRVPQDGVAQVGQVDPDLVGPAGLQAALQMGVAGEALQHRPVGDGPLARHVVHRHALPVGLVPGDGQVHGACVLLEAPHRHRLILPVEGVVLELVGQGQVGRVVLGGDEQAAGVPVDAVDDARADDPVDPRQAPAAVVEQGVDQGAVGVAGGGVDHQAHGLVDHDDILVLEDHVQGDVLGDGLQGHRVGDDHGDLIPDVQPLVFLQGLVLPVDPPLLQELLGGGPGQVGEDLGQEEVRPLAVLLGGEVDGHGLASFSPVKRTVSTSSTPPMTTPMSATLKTGKCMKVVSNISVT